MKIDIIQSNSTGCAILFDDIILIDAGVSFARIEAPGKIACVLLSHVHGDHLKPSTIRKIHVNNERVKFCCGGFLEQELLNIGLPADNIVVVEPGKKYKVDDFVFSPVVLDHDVPNYGYRLMRDGHKHIHATDTRSLDGIVANGYDSATIECNHDYAAAMAIINEKHIAGEFCHLERAVNTHLCVDKACKFIADNSISNFFPVHMGASTSSAVKDKLTAFAEIFPGEISI